MTSLASLVDLFPTLLDIAGIDQSTVIESLAGESLLAQLHDANAQGPQRAVVEYSAEAATAPMVAIRRICGVANPPAAFARAG